VLLLLLLLLLLLVLLLLLLLMAWSCLVIWVEGVEVYVWWICTFLLPTAI
jgi:hypothetical protein